jgi:hypothetical protein
LRVDRRLLAEIASAKTILDALLHVSFAINGIRNTSTSTTSSRANV